MHTASNKRPGESAVLIEPESAETTLLESRLDLRDVRITHLVETMTLDHILDSMLDANRSAEVPPERLSAKVVRHRLHQGDAVVVFDSLAGYFLSRYLFQALIEAGSDLDTVVMPAPSPETLDFLGQSIATATPEHQSAALAALARIGRRYLPQASELALAYALRAAEHGHPHQSLVGVQLAGAQLGGWTIGTDGQDDTRLPMARADLSGADLRRARFHPAGAP